MLAVVAVVACAVVIVIRGEVVVDDDAPVDRVVVKGTWISEHSATIASHLNVAVQGLPKLLKPATSSHDVRFRHRVSTTELELGE